MMPVGQYVNKWTSHTVFPDIRHMKIIYIIYLIGAHPIRDKGDW